MADQPRDPLPWHSASSYTQYNAFRKSSHYREIGNDEIRLLKILHEPKTDPRHYSIHCALITHQRDHAPPYTALPYAWGYGWAECQILLNHRPFSIRRNLYRFLLHAARLKPGTIDLLWIDAICIDQDDLHERAAQVQQMASIYSSAQNVFIWLGPSYQNSHRALEYLEDTADKTAKHHYRMWGGKTGQAISYICGRQYWTRLWVLQELMLAREVYLMCGECFIAWEPFREFLLALDQTAPSSRKYLPDHQNTRSSPAMRMVRQVIARDENRTLLRMLNETQQLRCEQIHDKIFALLGLVTDRGDLQADYTIPVPVLLNFVLREAYNTAKPDSIEQVTQDCEALEAWFELSPGTMFELMEHGTSKHLIPNGKTNIAVGKMTFWWILHYRHTQVLELFFDNAVITPNTLWKALSDNDPITMGLLLNTGHFDVNMANSEGDTMLHVAAHRGMTSIVAILLRSPSIEINSTGHESATPLLRALQHCDSLNEISRWRRSLSDQPSQFADAERLNSIEILKLLLGTEGIDVDCCATGTMTPLRQAIEMRDIEICSLLLSAGAGKHDDSYVCAAAATGSVKIVELLLDSSRFSLDTEDAQGRTAGFAAASIGDIALTEFLLDKGCRTKMFTLDRMSGWTILHEAVKHGHAPLVDYLLEDGRVNPDDTTRDGETALQIAMKRSYKPIVEIFQRHRTSPSDHKRVEAIDIPVLSSRQQ